MILSLNLILRESNVNIHDQIFVKGRSSVTCKLFGLYAKCTQLTRTPDFTAGGVMTGGQKISLQCLYFSFITYM